MNASDSTAVRLAVTMGDPRGIGPEIVLKALRNAALPDARLLVLGDGGVLRATGDLLGLPMHLSTGAVPAANAEEARLVQVGEFPVAELEPGRPDARSGRASLDYVEEAVRMALDGRVDAIVTGPINKEAIGAAGSPFAGHTEMLAALTGARRPVMLLVSDELRVALVTTHLALRDVPEALRGKDIAAVAEALSDGLTRFFDIGAPRLAVCGLNPHCGDGGRFGDEEARIVAPAVQRAREAGVDLDGPKPADTVFVQARNGDYDAVLALYHDQGMIPVKLDGLAHVVNVTLGLPFVRTSVGHGTAYDIAGSGRADESSLVQAIGLAARMVRAARREEAR